MNIEDRLREAFDNEAEQMRAPGGIVEDAIRRGKRRRTSRFLSGAAIALTLIGGTALAIQLAAGNGDDPEEITADQNQTTTTTPAVESNPAIAPFDWERVELPTPAGMEVYDVRVQSASGRFVALGEGYSAESGGASQLVWISENGHDWTLSSSATGGFSNGEVFSSEGGFIVVERGPLPDQISVLTSRDGLDLSRGSLDLPALLTNDGFVHFSGGASGNGVHVLAGVAESQPPQPPVVLEEAGIVLQEQPTTDQVTVSDLATGEFITSISIEMLYGGVNSEGLVVRDEADNIVVVIPWDLQAEAYDAYYSSGEKPTELTLEYEGVVVTFNEEQFTYRATEAATGELISEGSQDQLYEPGPLVITRPDTGETLVSLSMEQLYEAQEESYGNFDYAAFASSQALVLRSDDGVTWSQVDVADLVDGSPTGFSGLTYGPEGFVLQVFGRNEDGATRSTSALLRSSDGLEWTRVEDPPFNGIHAFVADDESYYAVGNVARQGLGILRSDDLENWEQVHAISDRSTWINGFSSGRLGLVATGQSDNYAEPPLIVSKEGKTLVLDALAGSLIVTDDDSNEILANISFNIYDEEPPEGIVVTDDETGFDVLNSAGALVMTITEADMEAAYTEPDFDERAYYPESVVFFSEDGDEWRRASTGGLDIAYMSGVAVGAEVIIISGDPIYEYSQGSVTIGGGETATTLRYADGGGPPPPFVWVGTPR